MKKLESTMLNMLLSLTGVCLLAATILSFVNNQTKEVIALSKNQALEKAIGEVTPAFDNSPRADSYKVEIGGDSLTIYPAMKAGELVGVAIESVSHNGFGGDVKVLVGFDKEGTLLNYSVLSMVETPGLGDKMLSWFKTDKNRQSILGAKLAASPLSVSKDGGSVDAITAATISSRAFLDAVNKAQQAFQMQP